MDAAPRPRSAGRRGRPKVSCATTQRQRSPRLLPAPGAFSRAREPDRVGGARRAHEDNLGEVERHGAVLGSQVVPALAPLDGAAQLPERLIRDPDRHHLAAAEPDFDPLHLLSQCHLVPPRSVAASTSSVSTPSPALGCRNATRVPLIPARASESISSTPTPCKRASAASMSS